MIVIVFILYIIAACLFLPIFVAFILGILEEIIYKEEENDQNSINHRSSE